MPFSCVRERNFIMENIFEREVPDRLIKIEAKMESWDKSKQQVYDNQREIIKLAERVEQ